VVFWDRALEILTGFKSEEMVGTKLHWKAFYPDARPCLADLLVDGDTERIRDYYHGVCRKTPLVDGGYECTDFFPRLRPAGKWLHVTASVTRDPAGNITGAMETVEDVTDQKKRDFVIGE